MEFTCEAVEMWKDRTEAKTCHISIFELDGGFNYFFGSPHFLGFHHPI